MARKIKVRTRFQNAVRDQQGFILRQASWAIEIKTFLFWEEYGEYYEARIDADERVAELSVILNGSA